MLPAKLERARMRLQDAIRRHSASIVRYLIVGGTTFALDFGLLVGFKEVVHVTVYIAATLSYLIALGFNFVLNRVWTFAARTSLEVHVTLYILLVIVNWLTTLFLIGAFQRLGLNYELAKLISIAPILTWNYLVYKMIFSIRKQPAVAGPTVVRPS
jgi:putative flippase GtrA